MGLYVPLPQHGSLSDRDKVWGSPDFVDTDQGFTGVSVGATMHRCSKSIGLM